MPLSGRSDHGHFQGAPSSSQRTQDYGSGASFDGSSREGQWPLLRQVSRIGSRTELPTAEAALDDLIDAIRDYAKEYLQDRDRYATSPNRAHHLPYIEAIAACRTDWELRTLIEIKHGLVHV
jgi:hypothetical protein